MVSCDDGKKGVALFRKNPDYLVITDLIMPDQEGIETIIQLRKEFPTVKIIAMSGGGRIGPDIYLDTAGRLGATKTFVKPFDHEEFLAAVQELAG